MNVRVEIKNQQPFTTPGGSICIDIASVTIITGENGVGKSILLKSIASRSDKYDNIVVDSTCNSMLWESVGEYYFMHQNDMLMMSIPTHSQSFNSWMFNCQKLCIPRKFSDIVKVWFDYFGLGEISIEEKPNFNGFSKSFRHFLKLNNVDIQDMGAGTVCIVNLILRILHAMCSYPTNLRNIFLYVLHPEIYLSRGNQKKVADFLCAISTLGAHVIIKTHSDAICNEVCKIAMQSYPQDKMDDFKVYNLVKQDNMTSIHDIEINKYRGFVDNAGTDFMNVATEYKSIMDAAFRNLKLDGKLK